MRSLFPSYLTFKHEQALFTTEGKVWKGDGLEIQMEIQRSRSSPADPDQTDPVADPERKWYRIRSSN